MKPVLGFVSEEKIVSISFRLFSEHIRTTLGIFKQKSKKKSEVTQREPEGLCLSEYFHSLL